MKIATFDLEADGFLDTVTRVWCAAVKDHSNGHVRLFRPGDMANLCLYLSGFDVLIGHNCIGYDFPVLRKIFGWDFHGKKVDTLLISRTQRPNRALPPGTDTRIGPHSVEAYGIRFNKPKIGHDDWTQFSEDMMRRCAGDVEIQYDIYNFLMEEGKGENWGAAHRLNARLFDILQRQEEYGWTVDREHINRCFYMLDRWIDRIDRAITPKLPVLREILEKKKEDGEYGFVSKPFKLDGTQSVIVQRYYSGCDDRVCGPFSRVGFRLVDLNSNQETKDFLLSLGWEPKEWNRDGEGNKRSPKFSKEDDFEGIQGSLGKLIAKRIQCRQRKSVLEGWVAAIRADGRIGAKVAGIASTGRLRHSVIVNVPNPNSKAFFATWMRRVFVAKPGWVMVGTDSKGNQMRQLAARMGDEDFTAAVLFGNSKDKTDLHSLNMKRTGIDNRNRVKNFFYGCILFGAGDKKTAKILDSTIAEAKETKAAYFREMPKLAEMLERMKEDWRKTAKATFNSKFNRMEWKNGYIKGLDGRPILVEFEKDILVYYLQSDEAIQMAAAYVHLYDSLIKSGYVWGLDFGYLIWMHDEWQLEVRPEIAAHVSELSNEAVAWAGRYYKIACPHEGESNIGRNWYETH